MSDDRTPEEKLESLIGRDVDPIITAAAKKALKRRCNENQREG